MLKLNPLIAVGTILLQSLFIALFNINLSISPDITALKKFLPFANMLVIILSTLAILAVRQIVIYTRKEMGINLLNEHLKQVEELVNSLHSQRHEHNRHLQTIQAMLYLDEINEAKGYLEGLADANNAMQELSNAGHPALTALLAAKLKVAETKNIEFDFAVKCCVTNYEIAPWDLCSLIGNLLDNALEAAVLKRHHRRVSLEIKAEDEQLVIYVYNNGPGIKKNQLDKLFIPGYSTKDSSARGFGLYIVKQLVDKYEGTIEVITEPRTTFIIYLPVNTGGNHNAKKPVNQDGIYPGNPASL